MQYPLWHKWQVTACGLVADATAIRGGNPLGIILTVTLAPLAATIIQLAISRTREFSADAGAAKLTGNPRALASALQRLESNARQIPMDTNPAFQPLLIINPFSGNFLSNLFRTHPSTEQRVKALLKIEQQGFRAI